MTTQDYMKELKEMPIWLIWNYKIKNGNKTKVPMSASGGKSGTNKEYQNTWVTYAEALKAAKKLNADGVGFVIPEGYFFVDVDDKPTDDPFIQTLFTRFNSYTEYSVSGNGIHIYGKADFSQIPTYIDAKDGKRKLSREFYMKNPHNKVELYIGGLTNRFAVFTGNVIVNEPLKECTQAVLTTLDKDMRRKKKHNYSSKRDGNRETFDIICNLRKQKNAEKFIKLFDKGDISGYGSHSEADIALCSLIAFRTGNDSELIDTIFRQSALMRDKWERDDYRTNTIENAIEACNGVFHFSLNERPDYIAYIPEKDLEVVVPTRLARHIRENLNYIFVKNSAMQGTLKYVYEDGCYRLYSDTMLLGLIKGYITSYNEDLVQMSKVNEVHSLLTTDLNYVPHEALNTNEDLINFQNGLLRLSDMQLLPHTPEVISTIQIPCEWTGIATPTPVFDAYIDTLSNNDTEIKQLLLEFAGAVLSNIKGSRMKKALFHVGKGNTGKTQLRALVEKLIGRENFSSIDLSDLEARFGTSNLYGKRLAGSADMSFMTVGELKVFKQATGGDSLFAEFKGMNGFEFYYNGLLWFCMNQLPKFGGDDGKWVYDRILLVESKNVISDEDQDKLLLDKMYAERNGIVFKMVTALKQVIENGYRYSEPESVTNARQEYMEENNTVIGFFNECMVERPNGKIQDSCTTGKVYNVYKEWCKDNNHGFAKTAKEFRDTLAGHFETTFADMTVRRGKGGTFYRNLTLANSVKEHYIKAYGYDDSDFLAGDSGGS